MPPDEPDRAGLPGGRTDRTREQDQSKYRRNEDDSERPRPIASRRPCRSHVRTLLGRYGP